MKTEEDLSPGLRWEDGPPALQPVGAGLLGPGRDTGGASRPLGLGEQVKAGRPLWLRPPPGERQFPLFPGGSGCGAPPGLAVPSVHPQCRSRRGSGPCPACAHACGCAGPCPRLTPFSSQPEPSQAEPARARCPGRVARTAWAEPGARGGAGSAGAAGPCLLLREPLCSGGRPRGGAAGLSALPRGRTRRVPARPPLRQEAKMAGLGRRRREGERGAPAM